MTLPPFEQVVEEHGAAVLRVCRAMLGPADADDAWSQTFLAALRAYPTIRPDSNVRAWLVTIAHRKAVDGYRANARGPVATDRLPDAPAPAGPDSFDHLSLWAAVGALPCRQRAAIAYRYLAGLSYREIGEALGSSEAAARRSAADGVAALRQSYPRHLAEESR